MIVLAVFVGLALYLGSPQDRDLSALAWLSGCWESTEGNRIIEEQWMKPRGSLMAGSGRTVTPGKPTFIEFLEIQAADSGIYYVARPGGGKPVPFKLVSAADGSWIFENPLHDFPQRIMYRKLSADSMKARIEGMMNGTLGGRDFNFRRVSCSPE